MFPSVRRLSKLKMVFLVAFITSLSACGGGDSNPIPVNSSVRVSPTSTKWNITPQVGCDPTSEESISDVYNDTIVSVSVLDADSRPLGDVELTIGLDLAGNSFGPRPPDAGTFAPLRLYEDKNSNGVVDDPDELVTAPGDPFFRTRTDKYTGIKMLILRVNLSCTYRGFMTAFAGSATFASLEVEVKEDETAP